MQDEPANQGAWPFMALNLPDALAEAAPGKRWELLPVTRAGGVGPVGGLGQGARGAAARARRRRLRLSGHGVYFTDRGIEELERRRGDEEVTLAWLAEQLRTFVDLNPDFETPVERLATWLARLDDEDE